MKIQIQKPLFAWDCLEDHPALATIKQLIALRHTGFEACLGELRRNPALAKLIGIRSISDVPRGWNISRFLDVLGQEPHRLELEAMFNQMIQRLGEVVPDLGKATAGDSTSLKARRLRRDRPQGAEGGDGATAAVACAAEDSGKPEKIEYDEHGLPQPSGGRKEYKDEKGNITKVISWFGYKLHLLVDAKYEVSLTYRISSSKAGDNELLPELVDQGRANLPQGRMQTLAYDKAADTVEVHKKLHESGIKPVIQNRALWKEEQEKMLPGHDGRSNIVYDEAGTLSHVGDLQCGEEVWTDDPGEAGDRPAAFSAGSPSHEFQAKVERNLWW